MKRILKCRKGSASIINVILVLILLLLSCVVFEYARLMVIAKGVRDNMQASIIAVATDNWDDTYNGVREGYSGGYELVEDSWEEIYDYGDVYNHLEKSLGLESLTNMLIKKEGNKIEYYIYDLDLVITNAQFAPSGEIEEFLVEGYVTLLVPISFGFEHLPPMKINLKLNSEYMSKF